MKKNEGNEIVKLISVQFIVCAVVFGIFSISFKGSSIEGQSRLRTELESLTAKDISVEELIERLKSHRSEGEAREETTEEGKTVAAEPTVIVEQAYNDKQGIKAVASVGSDILAGQLSKTSIVPVDGRISSPFGERISPISGFSEIHKGLDIAAAEGEKIAVAKDGTVKTVSYSAGRGKFIIVDHHDGSETLYQHCSSIAVEEGTVVRCGETIAYVGSTGDCTGPHLHLEYRINGVPCDPLVELFNSDDAT